MLIFKMILISKIMYKQLKDSQPTDNFLNSYFVSYISDKKNIRKESYEPMDRVSLRVTLYWERIYLLKCIFLFMNYKFSMNTIFVAFLWINFDVFAYCLKRHILDYTLLKRKNILNPKWNCFASKLPSTKE